MKASHSIIPRLETEKNGLYPEGSRNLRNQKNLFSLHEYICNSAYFPREVKFMLNHMYPFF